MVHAIYGLLIHVPYLAHIHNSLLQIWIEQGILGPAAVCWGMFVIASWAVRSVKYGSGSLLGWAGFTAVVGAILHGFVDVVFYVERTLPVVGFMLGYSTLLAKDLIDVKDAKDSRKHPISLALAIAGSLILVTIFFYRPLIAAWYANMGAISQTKTELSIYDPKHFDNPTMDQVRQNANLDTAEKFFQKSLDFQPTQQTAIHRLSMIALARGNYDQALSWMETVWLAGYRDNRTRLLYSDALVAAGQPEFAAQIAAGINWAVDRLLGQAYARYWSHQDFQRAAYAYQAVTLLNPSNTQAGNSLLQLEQILNK
jgi:tetratricopeptide (TPR) repeat protein